MVNLNVDLNHGVDLSVVLNVACCLTCLKVECWWFCINVAY